MGTQDATRLRRQVRRPGLTRPHVHRVKVTAAQEVALVEKADELGWTVSRLMVESALAGGADMAAARVSLSSEMFAVVRVLGRIGVNVNQIAKATNATGGVQPGAEPALAALCRLEDRMNALLDRMEAR